MNYCLTHKDIDDPDLLSIELPLDPELRTEIFRLKIIAVAKMKRMLTTLRTEKELLLLLKGMAPDGKIPRGILMEGRPAIHDAIKEFALAKKNDSINERRPDVES